jgi:hypothetical protein
MSGVETASMKSCRWVILQTCCKDTQQLMCSEHLHPGMTQRCRIQHSSKHTARVSQAEAAASCGDSSNISSASTSSMCHGSSVRLMKAQCYKWQSTLPTTVTQQRATLVLI